MVFGLFFTGFNRLFSFINIPSQGKLWRQSILALTLSLAWPVSNTLGHAASWSVNTDVNPLTVDFSFSDGRPMSFAKVKVVSEDGKTFQVGNADRNGLFSFVPDAGSLDAVWTLVASGDEGHDITASVTAASAADIVGRRTGVSSVMVWLLVASALVNIAVFCTYIERRWNR